VHGMRKNVCLGDALAETVHRSPSKREVVGSNPTGSSVICRSSVGERLQLNSYCAIIHSFSFLFELTHKNVEFTICEGIKSIDIDVAYICIL
jgi:hypothetical protein